MIRVEVPLSTNSTKAPQFKQITTINPFPPEYFSGKLQNSIPDLVIQTAESGR